MIESGTECAKCTGSGSTGLRLKHFSDMTNAAMKSGVREKEVEEEPSKACIQAQQLRPGRGFLHL